MQKFGDAGYSVFSILLEIYADEYHHKLNEEVRFNSALLCQKLRKRWTKVELILNYYQTINRISFRTTNGDIYIKFNKFKDVMDNWAGRKLCSNSVVTTSKNKKKNKEEDIKKIYKRKKPPSKITFGSHVKLTDDEHKKLIGDYGESLLNKYISKVNEYCKMHGKKYDDYNLTIRKWMRSDGVEKNKSELPTELICPKCGVCFFNKDGFTKEQYKCRECGTIIKLEVK